MCKVYLQYKRSYYMHRSTKRNASPPFLVLIFNKLCIWILKIYFPEKINTFEYRNQHPLSLQTHIKKNGTLSVRSTHIFPLGPPCYSLIYSIMSDNM